jgi:hypothetical protein
MLLQAVFHHTVGMAIYTCCGLHVLQVAAAASRGTMQQCVLSCYFFNFRAFETSLETAGTCLSQRRSRSMEGCSRTPQRHQRQAVKLQAAQQPEQRPPPCTSKQQQKQQTTSTTGYCPATGWRHRAYQVKPTTAGQDKQQASSSRSRHTRATRLLSPIHQTS